MSGKTLEKIYIVNLNLNLNQILFC